MASRVSVVVKDKEHRDNNAIRDNVRDSNIPSSLSVDHLKNLRDTGKAIGGNARVYKGNSVTHLDVTNVDGIHYDNYTGQRIIDYGNGSSDTVYRNNDALDIKYDIHNRYTDNMRGELVITLRPDPTPAPTPKPRPPIPPLERRPNQPELIQEPRRPPEPNYKIFDDPEPTFEADLQTYKKYEYFFGVDSLKMKEMNINPNSCLITGDILISDDTEYIKLNADYTINEFSNIEFYIIHKNTEYPIVPVHDESIKHERIFYGQPSRFKIDEDKEVIIYKDGEIVPNINFNEASLMQDGIYTISYTPKDISNLKQFNIQEKEGAAIVESSIRIKTILRLYDKYENPPSIFTMKIQEFGGSSLWQDSI